MIFFSREKIIIIHISLLIPLAKESLTGEQVHGSGALDDRSGRRPPTCEDTWPGVAGGGAAGVTGARTVGELS